MRSTSVTVSILLVLTACLTCTNAGPVAHTITQIINLDAGSNVEKSVVGINIGTVNTDSFNGPYNNIWGDVECRHLSNHPGSTLSVCKEFCKQTQDCTAFNYNEKSDDCVLRACGLPVPKPQWNHPPYHGYVIDTDTNKCPNNNGGCAHYCSNNDGSFRCSCREGYSLGNDSKSCDGNNPVTTSFENGECNIFEDEEICTCDKGFLYVKDPSPRCIQTGSDFQDMFCFKKSGKCFKYIKTRQTWDQAVQTCTDEKLKLAQPESPLKIRNYLLSNAYKLGGGISKHLDTWLGAKGNNNIGQQWIGTRDILDSANTLWYNSAGIKEISNCLVLVTEEWKINRNADKPLDTDNCKNFLPVLCENSNAADTSIEPRCKTYGSGSMTEKICHCPIGYSYETNFKEKCIKSTGGQGDLFCFENSGKCFKYIKTAKTWTEAEKDCKQQDLKLAMFQVSFPLAIIHYLEIEEKVKPVESWYTLDQENCHVIVGSTETVLKWKDITCTNSRPILCEK